MKFLIIILLFFSTIFSYSQTPDTCFTKEQIIVIASKAKEQKEQIQNLEQLTILLDNQISNYEFLRKNDSLYIQNMYYELNTYMVLDSINSEKIQTIEKDNKLKTKLNKFLLGLVIIVSTIAIAK